MTSVEQSPRHIPGVFAPGVESALAGVGGQDSFSQSVAARQVIQEHFSELGSTALQVVITATARSSPPTPPPGAP